MSFYKIVAAWISTLLLLRCSKQVLNEETVHLAVNRLFHPTYLMNKQSLRFADFASWQAAASFLNRFTNNEVVNVTFDGQSKTDWIISPPQQQLLIEKLSANNTQNVSLRFDWTLTKYVLKRRNRVSCIYNCFTLDLRRILTARENLSKSRCFSCEWSFTVFSS